MQGGENVLVQRVNTDTRSLQPGDMFVALRGERFDGHDYLAEAAEKGASAFLVHEDKAVLVPKPAAVISVQDTVSGLSRLAGEYRAGFDPRTVAVCGSNGKTTTKDLIASVLAKRFETQKSRASFNNHIGVPMTLLELEQRHDAAVLEAGTNHPGELDPLLKLIRPEFGVITSIGREHLEFFGDLAGVAREEGALADHLPENGLMLVNRESPEIETIICRAKCEVQTVGFSDACDWRAAEVRVSAAGTRFKVKSGSSLNGAEFAVQMPGEHHALNALFAVAVGHRLGLDAGDIAAGLIGCEPPAMRSRMEQARGVWILNDAYNANADSMTAAIRTLAAMECAGRRIAVLGDMAELGEHSTEAHVEAGREVAACNIDRLIAVGRFAKVTAEAASAGGMIGAEIFATVDEAGEAMKNTVREGDVVLVKASRSARLERLVNVLSAR